MPDAVISADDLIRNFGDQAYWEGIRIFEDCLKSKDLDAARGLAAATRKLVAKGYHLKPKPQETNERIDAGTKMANQG